MGDHYINLVLWLNDNSISFPSNLFSYRRSWHFRNPKNVRSNCAKTVRIKGTKSACECLEGDANPSGIFSTNTSPFSSVLYKIIFHPLFLSEALIISECKDCKGKPHDDDKSESLILRFNRLGKMVGSWKLLIYRLFFKQYIYSSNLFLYWYELFSILLIRGLNISAV